MAPRRSLAQTVFRDGAVYAAAGVLSQGIAFLLFPFFAHVFDPRDYGIIDLLGVIMTIVNLTVALEVAQGLGRSFAELDDQGRRRAYTSTAFTFSLLCYTAFAAITLALADPITSLLLGQDVDPTILRIAIGVYWANGLAYLATDLLRWQLRPKAYAAVAVTTAGTVTLASALYVLVLDLDVEGAILGQLTGFLLGGALAYGLARDLYRLRIDRSLLREMLAYSIPLVPASAGVFLNGYADRVAIQARLTLADVGVYGVAYRLSVIVSLTLIGFQGALMPQVLRHHQRAETPGDLARVFRLFCALALGVLMLVSTFADEILRVLTPPAYYEAERLVPFVVAGAFLAGMYIFAGGLNIARRTRQLAVITTTCGVTNLALALLLVGPLGVTGAALSFMASQAGAFAVTMAASQRFYPVPHQWRRLAAGAVCGAAGTAVGWLLPAVEQDAWALPAKLVVAATTLLLLAALLTDADEREMGRRVLASWVRRIRPGRRAAAHPSRPA
jgi:O-antigen/teichoic acid export membrane protein